MTSPSLFRYAVPAMEPQNPIDTVATTLRQIDRAFDWREKLWSAMRMALGCLSLFLVVVAGVELAQVHAAQSWRAQPARLISVTLERPTRQGHDPYWQYSFELTESGERGQTTDVRPGDFPMTFLIWSTHHEYAARYRAGQAITVYRALEGGKVYLERGGYGPMSLLLAGGLALGAALFWWRGKRAELQARNGVER